MRQPLRFLRDFPLRFVPIIGVTGRAGGMNRKLDRFDIALLNLLQADNLATAETLARAVPLSSSAIARRVRSLREEGLIAADMALLAPALTADRLRAIVNVQVHEHAEEKGIAGLRARLAGADEVQLLLNIAGAFDLLVLVVTRNMAEFNAFADAHFASDPAVRRYETSFVKGEVKNRPIVLLDARDEAR
jgi:Lrp/AsnC family transcriptional regulator, leucine-responsive regulatory protein